MEKQAITIQASNIMQNDILKIDLQNSEYSSAEYALGINGSLYLKNPNNNDTTVSVATWAGTGEAIAVSGTVYATDGITINATSSGGSAYGVKGDLEVDNSTYLKPALAMPFNVSSYEKPL